MLSLDQSSRAVRMMCMYDMWFARGEWGGILKGTFHVQVEVNGEKSLPSIPVGPQENFEWLKWLF